MPPWSWMASWAMVRAWPDRKGRAGEGVEVLRRESVHGAGEGLGHGGRPQGGRAGELDVGVHLGCAVGQRLELVDRDTELLAHLEVFHGGLQRGLHEADGAGAVGDPAEGGGATQ